MRLSAWLALATVCAIVGVGMQLAPLPPGPDCITELVHLEQRPFAQTNGTVIHSPSIQPVFRLLPAVHNLPTELTLESVYGLHDVTLPDWNGIPLFRDPSRDQLLEFLTEHLVMFAERRLSVVTGTDFRSSGATKLYLDARS